MNRPTAQPLTRREVDPTHAYVPRLEALRGLGALIVAAYHCAQSQWAPGRSLFSSLHEDGPFWSVAATLFRILCNGHGALITFFVISGFVLARSLDRGPAAFLPAATRYFTGRVFRIYPAIISTVLLFAALFWFFGLSLPDVTAAQYTPLSILQNMLLLHTDIDGVMWSLQLEAVAIFVIFAAFRAQKRWGLGPIILLILVLTALSFHRPWAYLLGPAKPFGFLYAFVCGVLLQGIPPEKIRALAPRRAALWFLLALVVFFGTRPLTGHWAPVAETLAASIMIALLAYGPPLRATRVLDAALPRFYGKISYSFYVLHPLALIFLWDMREQISALRATGLPSLAIVLGFALLSTAAITPLAWLSWRFVEMAGIALGRRLLHAPLRFKAAPLPASEK